ncbi:UDP-URONIC ACID TRANSPORTER 1-like [Acanthaster planci]|uniref:UDP-URONIC ACID TRANSPORTER 1-like n=1 Tax=Acanthaster planci TaxID=133434 RepID=A0A8B7Z7Z4_ACAPL|nr:UDP-URONIC ACID TRANSPORTER 1-like [Acanthaster planci]
MPTPHIRTMTYLVMSGWILASIGLSNINKWLFNEERFSYPVFLTTLHMLSACLFGSVVLRYTPLGAAFGEGNARLQLPPGLTLRILVLSVVFTSAVTLGNIALRHLYISFLKMVFALSPLVTVLLSRALFQRPVNNYVYMSMVPLCFGSMLCITGEVNFNVYGFLAAVGATILRALKSLLQGVLLKEQRIDSIRLLYHMSIPSSAMLLVATLFLEPTALSPSSFSTSTAAPSPVATASGIPWWPAIVTLRLPALLLMSCLCAVGYNLMTFLVTFYTSPVALQVLGNAAVVLDVAVSLVVFRNQVSWLSLGGILCVMLGTVMYQEAGSVKWHNPNFWVLVQDFFRRKEKSWRVCISMSDTPCPYTRGSVLERTEKVYQQKRKLFHCIQ